MNAHEAAELTAEAIVKYDQRKYNAFKDGRKSATQKWFDQQVLDACRVRQCYVELRVTIPRKYQIGDYTMLVAFAEGWKEGVHALVLAGEFEISHSKWTLIAVRWRGDW